MSFASAIHNPLAINLQGQLRRLLAHIQPGTQYHASLTNAHTTRQLLATLSSLLAVPEFTQLVATYFRPILLDLCVRWVESEEHLEEHLIALCYLLEVHEHLFPVLNQLIRKNYSETPLAFITGSPSPTSIDTTRVQRILLAYYRILRANGELPRYLSWSLEPLSKLVWTPYLDNGVRLLSIRCYAMQTGMGEEERCKIEHEVLGEPCGVDCQLSYGKNIDGSEREVDGWVMPAVELTRIREERDKIVTSTMDYYFREETDTAPELEDSSLSPLLANVHGVLLLRSSRSSSVTSSFIPLPSSIDALRQLALNISLRLPILLTSAPSAGKALLLSHLAGLLHPDKQNQIVIIHLADTSLDPRALLGSYISSTTHPGTFEWKEGVLVRAMREGRWVVFEDIDRGSNEVLGVIKPLVKTLGIDKWIGGRAQIHVPSRGTVVAHNDFMLFATRSLFPSKIGTYPPPTFFGSHSFSEVTIKSPSLEELRNIVNAKYPRLSGSAGDAVISLWNSVIKLGSQGSGRDIGIRELLKFCQRIESLLPASHQPMDVDHDSGRPSTFAEIYPNPSLRQDMFLEARDVFFGAGASTTSARAHAKAVAEAIGNELELDLERQQWVLEGKVPEFDIEKDANGRSIAVRLGRTRIPACSVAGDLAPTPSRPFAMHKPAVLLLSRIANAIVQGEPVLLTGETGTGKTSAVSHLAFLLHRPLISLNLSHQTESSDLIGGLKPIDARIPGSVIQERFLALFSATFSRRKNEKFEIEVRKAVNERKWKRAVGLWKESVRLALQRIQAQEVEVDRLSRDRDLDAETPRKRRKTARGEPKASEYGWSAFLQEVEEFEIQHVHGKGKFAFGFVEGPLVKALKSGAWVLLDEVNLASPETLECISGLLHGPTASITLTEHGSLEPIPRHSDFRLFACMNPATDVGKKDLPPSIRSRFTEIDVPPPDADKETLLSIISQYIGHIAVGDKRIIMDVAEFYAAVKQVAESRQIADGANHRPHFSMRTLVRALTFAADTASAYSLRRSVWEGCLMAFTMVLDSTSAEVVTVLARKHLLSGISNPRSLLAKDPATPTQGVHIKFGPFYLEKGPLEEDLSEEYVMTPSVQQKLIDLSRIILTRRFPVLIEGPTSSGKTSSVEYLAKRTGHRFVRINNHEHTDIQEYLGSYVSDPVTGKLVFKDGLLVQALRHGHWIVLDELNLAPTDVLEALNRLLDDNRELVIPETQEVVRPHPHFMLFATQNPPGLYAGRKILSRAFRNRFLEVHFEDVPQFELETILCQRCRIAPSYGKRIVTVFRELQKRRQTGRVFESKQGFATLRDLFRWAGRDAVGYQELAENGYMLLAERTRRSEDKLVVKEVIESVMGVGIDEDAMYDLSRPDLDMHSFLGHTLPQTPTTIWTNAMQRLYTLVCRGLKFNEPILLVGETGSGKTSVCQVFAESSSQRLLALNCHQNTETADLIGGLRPVRNRSNLRAEIMAEASQILKEVGVEAVPANIDAVAATLSSLLKGDAELSPDTRSRLEDMRSRVLRLHSIFEWQDGPLIEAMHHGDVFLLDEISLADDSVLERLNSVLEPGRSIVLAERGGTDSEQPAIRASENFKLIATMNPGGDYGKKELSPALRNRFTEIWVPAVNDRKDLELIVSSLWCHDSLRSYTSSVLDFVDWLCARVEDRSLRGLRDILAWVIFTNSTFTSEESQRIPADELFHHAAHMTYLDGLSSLPQLAGYSRDALEHLKADASIKLQELVPLVERMGSTVPFHDPATYIQLGSFAITKGKGNSYPGTFNFAAPTTLNNAMRVVRACQVMKPILLEGSPGVGKTSLITALANISGHKLCRINLSDQTDIIDLFGSDLPVEGGSAGQFAWKDAEFLKALQDGDWVLLDEMNLAPQAVLEGLNAILDHRGEVYIPELNRSFKRHPSFRLFAAQNPLHQGGGRKGLPKSFINRFTKVYIDELSLDDLNIVCSHIFPGIDESTLRAMISFNIQLNDSVNSQRAFAQDGSPWEFNLRDVIRWGTLCSSSPHRRPEAYLHSVYLHRFRTSRDREFARAIFDKAFDAASERLEECPPWTITASGIRVGHFATSRRNMAPFSRPCRVLKMQLSALESLGDCILQSWLAILTGPRNSGKTDIVRALAQLTGNHLKEISVNSATDTMDILGSFEQVDTRRRLVAVLDEVVELLEVDLRSLVGSKAMVFFQSQARALWSTLQTTATHNLQNMMERISALISNLAESQSTSKVRYQEILTLLESLSSSLSSAGQFEWIDGPLITAMKTGQWLLLDGANLCGPSVLDRLNSLCEAGGSLTLSERGFVDGQIQHIKPHEDFRLFMSVDPHHGELSRAMRNRGIEIALLSHPLGDDVNTLRDHFRLPLSSPLSSMSPSLQGTMFEIARRGLAQHNVSESSLFLFSPTGRSLVQDSALSSVVDQAPSLMRYLPILDEGPWVHFLSRTLAPAYMPYVSRYLNDHSHQNSPSTLIRDFVNRYPLKDLTTALTPFREAYIQDKNLQPAFTLSQPMYFFWNDGSISRDTLVVDFCASRAVVLEILNLDAALFLCNQSNADNLVETEHTPKEKDRRVRQAVIELYKAILGVSVNVLKFSASSLLCTKLASTMLSFTKDLRKAINSPSYDFSALHAISRWLLGALKLCPPLFTDLLNRVKELHQVIALSTGRGLFAMWSQFHLPEIPDTVRQSTDVTERLACSLVDIPNAPAIRRQAFIVMSMETLPAFLKAQKTLPLMDVRATLDECLRANSKETASRKSSVIDPRLTILELYCLASCFRKGDSLVSNDALQEIISLACSISGTSLSRLIPYQHLVWALEVENDKPCLNASAQISFLEGLWKSQPMISSISGPSVLFHPILLHGVIIACDMDRVPLSALAQHENILQDRARLATLQSRQHTNRMTQLTNIFYQTLSIIASSFSSSYDPLVYQQIQEAAANIEASFPISFDTIISLLVSSGDDAFVSSIQKELLPLQTMVSGGTPLQKMGMAWIGISRLMLDLIVPDSPMDPAVVQNSTYHRLQREEMGINAQIALHQQLEVLLTGNQDNEIIQYLLPQLAEIRQHLAKMPDLPSRSNVARLHLFWSEVVQFQANVLSPSKIDNMIHAILRDDENACQRERVTQESLEGFYQRLDTLYPEFTDLNTLLKLAVLQMRFGLRVLVESSSSAFLDKTRAKFASNLLAFPSANSASQMIQSFKDLGPSSTTPFHHILLTLGALSLQRSLGVQKHQHLTSVDIIYEQATRLWLIDRAKEQKLNEEASTLYRKVEHNSVDDADIEEEEFLAMFPTFEDTLENVEPPPRSGHPRPSLLVRPADMSTLLHIHYDLNGLTHMPSTNKFSEMKQTTIKELITEAPESLPETLDEVAIPFEFSLLRENISILDTGRVSPKTHYNFYSDPNYQELKKGASVVESLKRRLEVISEDWPDQMVVKHLAERCSTILASNSKSPVPKVLAMVEQLLVQSEDWQLYSNRDNSIKVHQDELVSLVVDWRRLELSCWQTLLDSQTKASTEGLPEWWFRLYDALVRGSLAAVEQDHGNADHHLDHYIDSLIPLLDDFIKSSLLGQFESRMRLVYSFERYLSSLAPFKPSMQCIALQRVGRVLSATYRYYGLFTDSISRYLADQKAVLERDVKALVKLASWKDVNVQALKQSAQRTHRQLYKIMRRYRDILRQPASGRFQPHIAGDADSHSLPLSDISRTGPAVHLHQVPLLPYSGNLTIVPAHFLNLKKTLERYEALISKRLRPFIASQSAQLLDDRAIEIITTSKALASLALPSDSSPELRVKHQKALLVRKRRAWADMLKELKRGGLAINVKSDVLRQNSSQKWIREQPTFSNRQISNIEVAKGETYYLKLCGSLPSLRLGLPAHHPDLTTRELQRGLMFLESGFAMGVDLRARLVTGLSTYHQLQCALDRLQILSLSQGDIQQGSGPLAYVSSVNDLLRKVLHALFELRDNAQAFAQLAQNTSVSSSFFSEISMTIDMTTDVLKRVEPLEGGVRTTVIPYLIREERDLLLQAENHISVTCATISTWRQKYSQLKHLLVPLQNWLDEQHVVPLSSSVELVDSSGHKTESLLNALLISMQSLITRCPDTIEDPDTIEEPEKYILRGYQFARDFTHGLNLGSIANQLDEFLLEISSQSHFRDTLNKIIPFFLLYLALAKDQLTVLSNWMKSLFKFDFVLCCVMQTLSQQGFCKPEEGDSEAGGKAVDTTGGTGIGEGTGADNISKEIEDESQVEGLKGDETAPNQAEGKHDDGDAIEMADDFGGALEDVAESDDEDNKANSDAESDPEFDETLGDLDDFDQSAVDEKMWGDERGPEDSSHGDEKADQDLSNEQDGPSEVIAKEHENTNARQKDDKTEAEDEKAHDVEEETDVQEGEDNEFNDPNINGSKMDDHVPEAHTLDLPDEMDLDLGGDDVDKSEGDDDEAMLEDEQVSMEDGDGDIDEDLPINELKECPIPNEAEETTPGNEQETNDIGAKEGTEDENEADRDDDKQPPEHIIARPELSNQGGTTDPREIINPEAGESTSTGEGGRSEGQAGEASATEEQAPGEERASEVAPSTDSLPADNNGQGSATSGTQQGSAPSLSEPQPVTNPLRSLGDTLKEIRQRFDEILNQTEAPREHIGNSNTQSQIEYLQPEDTDHDMQALGPAGDDHTAKLDQLTIIDDNLEIDDPAMALDSNMQFNPETHEKPARQPELPNQDLDGTAPRLDAEGAILQASSVVQEDIQAELGTEKRTADDESMAEDNLNVEMQLREWRASDYPEAAAEHMWRLYDSLTHDLAYTLCEQLRLILEPTMATRLKGDYRTGKRLNMKKVISYIASDYTKDKIWLRRTRPSQREYQVLISIDDSRSMADSHIHLAYQTLALISKALGRLESGDVAIAKFGEAFDLLHGFDIPFSDQAGAKVLNAFRFSQKATNMFSLLETSLKVLEHARERKSMSSASAADLWQLHIIISDGMCQDHAKLRTLIRKAEEQRVMIVFIILDSLTTASTEPGSSTDPKHGSILNMDKAEFKTVDGKMELQLQKYLDSFPFEYYVILRQVQALPDVLAGTLKQFLERISEQ